MQNGGAALCGGGGAALGTGHAELPLGGGGRFGDRGVGMVADLRGLLRSRVTPCGVSSSLTKAEGRATTTTVRVASGASAPGAGVAGGPWTPDAAVLAAPAGTSGPCCW